MTGSLTVYSIDCWASAGYGAEGCAALETQLRKCMDSPVRLNTIDCDHCLTRSFHAEIPREEEEHRQLPLDENASQGRRSSQEGWCPWLKC